MTEPKTNLGTADTLTAIQSPSMLADRYELLGFLGAGGMGAVYRVRDKELDEIVALKMLRPELSRDPTALERFRREVTIARRVTHDNVARTFDIGDHRGEKFLTMECVDGGSLAARIGEKGALSERDVIDVALAITAGLAAAHRAGVVHRDLKPENVLFARDGRVVVTDFGIAHAGEGGQSGVIGTPAYMAPEQLSPGPVDARADIYALGAVIFEMLTGEPAWKGDSAMQVLALRFTAKTPPDPQRVRPSVKDALRSITMRCLAVAPSDRFASADDVASALRSASIETAATQPISTRTVVDVPRPTRAGKTVAVLPFANEGPDSDQYVADGVTGDIIDTLSMTRGLLVRPWAVVARVARRDRSLDEVARELGVQVIVEGSVRRIAEKFRLGVRVIGADDGFQLWAKRFDSSLEGLLVTSDSAARAIADVLTTELPVMAAPAVGNPAAIDLYLRAKETFLRTWHDTAKGAAELFERALALAPSDPKILVATAQAYVRMLFFGEGDREVVVARTRELTERAVVMAPDFGDAWAALAGQRLNVGDPIGAAAALRSGLARAPNSALLQDYVGRMFIEINPVDEGVARLEIALGLDPTILAARVELSRVLALRGEWARAESLLVTADESSPALDATRGRQALWQGRTIEVPSAGPDTYARFYSTLDREAGLTAEQRAFMARREKNASGRVQPSLTQRNAEVHAFMGEHDEAFAAMERAIDYGLIDLVWLELCPLFAEMRSDARYARVHAKLEERADRIRETLRRGA